MNYGYTPPRIDDATKSFIGVGTRELTIAGIGLVGAIMIYMTALPLTIRIGLAIIAAGAGLGIAFGRDPKTGRKFEQILTQRLSYYGRDKFLQKGTDHKEEYHYVQEPRETARKPQNPPKEFFKVQPIDLTVTYVIQLFSIAFLGVLVAYLWGGGLQNDVIRFNSGHITNGLF